MQVGSTVTAKTKQLKKYSLFSFTEKRTPQGLIDVDCVPSSWIRYDNELCSCVVHYPGPPYAEEDNKLLIELIRAQAEAPEDWPWYPIELRGHADTFNQGMKRTELLETNPYAFTTDSESDAKLKADEITNGFKSRSKQVSKTVAQVLEISEHFDLSGDENGSEDYIEGTSSDDAPIAVSRGKKKSQKATRAVVSKKACGRGYRNQTKYQSPPKTQASTSGGSKPSGTTAVAPHSKPAFKKKFVKTSNGSKPMPDTIQQQGANPNVVQPESVSILEKNAVIQKYLLDAPEAVQEMIKDFPTDTALIYVTMKKLSNEVTNVVEQIQGLRSAIERSLTAKGNQVSVVTFAGKYNFEKLATEANFKAFDEQLKNEEIVNDLKTAIECLLDRDPQKTITAIIKKFFHRSFAMQCTAFRKSGDKFLLKGTRFYDILFDFAIRFHKGSAGGIVTEKDFYQSLSSCLTNAKDWEGNRKNRPIPAARAVAQVAAPVAAPMPAPAGAAAPADELA